VLLAYVLGIFAVGAGLSLKVRGTSDLFQAGGHSPWWASGLSGFMTMFSAGTFVVWGGIAYRLGLVAVMINLCYGVAALLVGYFVAGRWKQIGVRTPGQFIQLRFGTAALHFYTWVMMVYRMVSTGVALYSLAIMLVNLIPLAEGNPLRDPTTGNLSLTWAVMLFGGCVIVYTMLGGLWAVLMTDVLQFIILNLAVVFMIPLIVALPEMGGFLERAPEGFLMPVGGGYTWYFLVGWCAIHFFMVGAEWAFAQRFICVPSARDARRSAYLFGALYLISPILWLAPPLAWRVIHPIPDGATDEQIVRLAEGAYIRACMHVLPVGMVGLMMAAMFSATASMVSSQLNVFAGVLTEDLYAKAFTRPSDRHLLMAGRGFSLLLGGVLIALALAVPWLGGAENVVIAAASLVTTPLLAPTIFGLFSRRMNSSAVWVTAAVCVTAGALTLGLFDAVAALLRDTFGASDAVVDAIARLSLAGWLQPYGQMPEIVVGVMLPVVVLGVVWLCSRGTAAGWTRVERLTPQARSADAVERSADPTPAYIVAGTLVACAAMMGTLTLFVPKDQAQLLIFVGALVVLAATIALVTRRRVVVARRLDAERRGEDVRR
jgi:Na+/proline symporter